MSAQLILRRANNAVRAEVETRTGDGGVIEVRVAPVGETPTIISFKVWELPEGTHSLREIAFAADVALTLQAPVARNGATCAATGGPVDLTFVFQPRQDHVLVLLYYSKHDAWQRLSGRASKRELAEFSEALLNLLEPLEAA